MFEMICEFARMTTRNNYLRKRVISIRKIDRVVAVRPIERPRKTATDETTSGQDPNTMHSDDTETIFEKYDAYGKVRLHTHTTTSPFNKKV